MSDLAAFLAEGWAALEAASRDADDPMRLVALASLGAEGPQARFVVLRRADARAAELEVHTDSATPKVEELSADPRAALVAWSPERRLQVRATGRVGIRAGTAAEWALVPAEARVSYGTEPRPGTPIDGAYAYDKPAREERFAVLILHVEAMDLVHLPERHRRARFLRGDGFRGQWLAP
ncbi:pyridoxamine 5'-phosphate oxidase family protein [Wenxinia marina]|uniref:Pyridoxamine-phosphate oxidase n=1 Tax=Wenxinia marina DSM 24838 TaxID=1123501 RepID=A0A0D0PAE9_9RHOB|nr:pyridoxamine 5'-phosphate oxidase family protein [Wenxinia marina]KIQ68476.1 Pyridoxamine-phosphate oxidase [Wenxinia marina DSM 24838]GGL66073.1 hypothetical protein GCM10011392_20870 [Wenxinia marina]